MSNNHHPVTTGQEVPHHQRMPPVLVRLPGCTGRLQMKRKMSSNPSCKCWIIKCLVLVGSSWSRSRKLPLKEDQLTAVPDRPFSSVCLLSPFNYHIWWEEIYAIIQDSPWDTKIPLGDILGEVDHDNISLLQYSFDQCSCRGDTRDNSSHTSPQWLSISWILSLTYVPHPDCQGHNNSVNSQRSNAHPTEILVSMTNS